MSEKLSDSRRDETKLRKERDSLRIELEEIVPKNVYVRLMKKLKVKVQRIRVEIKAKNKNKSQDIRRRRIRKTWMSFPTSRKRWMSLAS